MNRSKQDRGKTICHECHTPIGEGFRRWPIKDTPGAYWRVCLDCWDTNYAALRQRLRVDQ